ncbi:hypothetical protein [Oxalobacter formigenes]|nr:hypothetical protein [Oxalobacter formigenes]
MANLGVFSLFQGTLAESVILKVEFILVAYLPIDNRITMNGYE